MRGYVVDKKTSKHQIQHTRLKTLFLIQHLLFWIYNKLKSGRTENKLRLRMLIYKKKQKCSKQRQQPEDSCLIQYSTHIPSWFPASDCQTTTTFIWNPSEYQTINDWVCDKTCFSSSYYLPYIFQNACFTGENPLLLAAKLFWTHTQDANPMSGKAIVVGMTFPSNFQSKSFCNKLFEKSRSSTTVCCLATWLLPGQPVTENESFPFPCWYGTNV